MEGGGREDNRYKAKQENASKCIILHRAFYLGGHKPLIAKRDRVT